MGKRRPKRIVWASELVELESEDSFLLFVREALDTYGWLSYHTHRSDKSDKGFPDINAARIGKDGRRRLLYAELKREGEQPTPPQQRWLGLLGQMEDAHCPGSPVEVYLWRPSDRDQVLRVLA